MIEAVIFDMDGVIIDSEPLQSEAFEVLLKQYDKNPVRNAQGLISEPGISEEINCKKILQQYKVKESLKKFMKKRGTIYEKLLSKKIKPMKDLLPLLRQIKKKNIKTAIATSSPQNQIKIVLKYLDIKPYFEVTVGREDVKRLKPHPDLYEKAVKILGVNSKKSIVLEDSESGVVSAKTAGLYVIAIPSEYTKHQNFSQADMIVESLSEFHTLLKTL